MSKQYENDIAKQLYRETPSGIKTYRCGYSGNNAMPQPDILITDMTQNYAIELKGPIQGDRCYVDAEDIQQLRDCGGGRTGTALVVKFSRREPLVVRYFDEVTTSGGQEVVPDDYNNRDPAEKLVALIPNAFDPRVTDSGALALTKPDTDDWPSASAGADDVSAILSGLGIVTKGSVEVA